MSGLVAVLGTDLAWSTMPGRYACWSCNSCCYRSSRLLQVAWKLADIVTAVLIGVATCESGAATVHISSAIPLTPFLKTTFEFATDFFFFVPLQLIIHFICVCALNEQYFV